MNTTDFTTIYEELLNNPEAFFAGAVGFYCVLTAAVSLILFSYFSYRIFRISLSVSGCIGLGILGYLFVGEPIVAAMGESAPAVVNLPALLGVVFAIVGLILAKFLYKLVLFLCTAVGAFFLYKTVLTTFSVALPEFLMLDTAEGLIIAAAIGALLTGVLMLLLFKPIYILSTSLLGTGIAVVLLLFALFPHNAETVLILGIVFGMPAGIPAVVYQFRHSRS